MLGRAVPGKRIWRNSDTATRSDPYLTWASNRFAIGTLAERTARYVMLVHLPDNHTAEATSPGVAEATSPLPAGLCRTLRWEQGSEMAGPVQLAADLGARIYFCEAPTRQGSFY